MITFFIFYNNLKYATFLSNSILQTNNNTNLIGIAEKITQSSISHCNRTYPHIIISDENTHKKLQKTLKFDYISITIPQNEPLITQKICNQVNKFTCDLFFSHKLDLYNFKKYVYNIMQELKFNTTLCGTQYLLDCIVYAHENPYTNIDLNYIKSIYTPLSKKYNTTINSINWNIYTSISDMYKSTNAEFRKNIYGIDFGITPQKIIQVFSSLY